MQSCESRTFTLSLPWYIILFLNVTIVVTIVVTFVVVVITNSDIIVTQGHQEGKVRHQICLTDQI